MDSIPKSFFKHTFNQGTGLLACEKSITDKTNTFTELHIRNGYGGKKLKVFIYCACNIHDRSFKTFCGVPLFKAASGPVYNKCRLWVPFSTNAKLNKTAKWCSLSHVPPSLTLL